MRVFRSLGIRWAEPRPARSEEAKDDLTTAPERAAGALHPDALAVAPPRELWTPLPRPVPGRSVTGTLPDDPFARVVLRLPRDWSGRVVVSGSPGITSERGLDIYWSDFLLSRGDAFACTDKVVRAVADGATLYVPQSAECGIARWYPRLKALGVLAREEARRFYGKAPARVYAVGVSNGGYLARCAAEDPSPWLDGALEVSGVFWTSGPESLLARLPQALRAMEGATPDRSALEAAGFGAEPPWDTLRDSYARTFWECSLALFVWDVDPDYAGPLSRYDPAARPAAVRERIAAASHTGLLRVPLLSLAGRRDFLIPCRDHAEAYQRLAASCGAAHLHGLSVVEAGTHVDADKASSPQAEPLMPHAHRLFERLVKRVEEGVTAS